ncbi:hypothetical protein MVEG_03604 [Podila verticillata NRRL 6337]|nr:hypothetical protein MVEG_03604 [Podila verticillata NRRL 6337]
MASGDEQQRRRRRLLDESNDPNPAAGQGQHAGTPNHHIGGGAQHPISTTTAQQDITSTVHYLTDMLRPQRVKQQKQFPKACMIHQLYSLVTDHTAVDRSLAHLINDGQIRKFYLGGTGSDEFAIMLTPAYLEQIRQTKQQYLDDMKDSEARVSSIWSANKRKAETGLETGSRLTKKRVVPTKSTANATKSTAVATGDGSDVPMDTIFDRFEQLISSGSCVEVAIQHSNLQALIGATEEDITTLMHYSLLTRGLSAPANPHLVNLNQPTSASSSPGPSGGGGGGHHALNQLIATTNMAKSKEITSSSSSSTSLASAPIVTPSITRTVIPGAAIGAAARASGKRQPADNVAYRFSFPKGGLFVTHFLKGRLEILRAIKRQMFGDILVSVLESKPLRGSFLPHEFHIHDLIGSGRVESVTTTSGQLLKLTQKGQASIKSK